MIDEIVASRSAPLRVIALKSDDKTVDVQSSQKVIVNVGDIVVSLGDRAQRARWALTFCKANGLIAAKKCLAMRLGRAYVNRTCLSLCHERTIQRR